MPEAPWSKVESLFHVALRLSPDERDKFLAQACQGDERRTDPALHRCGVSRLGFDCGILRRQVRCLSALVP